MSRLHGRNGVLRLKDKDGNETVWEVTEWAIDARGGSLFTLPEITIQAQNEIRED